MTVLSIAPDARQQDTPSVRASGTEFAYLTSTAPPSRPNRLRHATLQWAQKDGTYFSLSRAEPV